MSAFFRFASVLTNRRFAIAAFLVPLGIRAIPEIIVGPYPVGFDTIAFYVPVTLDWAAGKVGPIQMLGSAPLMYTISTLVYMVTHVNPVWIFKVMGPILYGSMILALFSFLRAGLDWNDRLAFGGALLTSLYFVTLRVSWDLYRDMLGLTFILIALVYLSKPKGLRKYCLLGLSIVGAVTANQLTGIIVLFLAGSRAFTELWKGGKSQFRNLVLTAAPGIAVFFSIIYVDVGVFGNSIGQPQPAVPGLQSINNSLGFLAFAYLPLFPLVALGVRRVPSSGLKIWGFVCIVASVTVLLPFFSLNVASYRWSLLTSIPLCVFAAAGLARLMAVKLNVEMGRWLQARVLPIFSIIIVLSAILYIALPAQQAMPYYATFPGLLPTSMVQDTVPLSDMQNLRVTLDMAGANMGPGTALITHQAIYGWARAYLPSTDHIVNYGYSNPLEGVQIARTSGYSSVLMIWWVNGSGWHGQPSIPSDFVPLMVYGNMALYTYY